jgi:photosystem II stability/assembly factor-like uncharacterized protein
MKHSLQLVLLLLLVTAVALAKKDPAAEKHADARKGAQTTSNVPFLSRAAVGTWDTLSVPHVSNQFDDVIALPGGVIWLGGFVSGTDEDFVMRSTDNGATWTRKSLISFTNSLGYALAARDANIALAATWIGDIYRTTDGGSTWNLVYNYGNGNGYFDGIKFTGGDSVMALGDADASGLCVVKSTDAGATWTRFTNLPTAEANPNLISSSSYHQPMDGMGTYVWMTTYIGSGTAPRLLRTTDFGTTWTSAEVLLTGGLSNAYNIRSINMVNQTTGWLIPRQTAAGVRCFVHKTTDGGATWSDTILVERGTTVASVKPMRGTNNLLALGWLGNDPKAWWSTDGGGTWPVISPTATGDGSDLRNASFVSTQLGYVTGLYKAYKFTPPGSTGVEPQPGELPQSYTLNQNYPNPFNPSTTIEYSIPTAGSVQLKVYDMIGREVATLVNQEQVAGKYAVMFDARTLASGVYFYRLVSGSFVSTKSLVLVK